MFCFKGDLHIHTVLSPCGDLEMSPKAIVQRALEQKMDMIAITDHNSTRQAKVVRDVAKPLGLKVFCGAEVTTKEEAHCLALFDDDAALDEFQIYLDEHLPDIKNDVHRFGYQVSVNENEEIVFEEERLLISAIDESVEQIEQQVHRLGGLFIPAHVDKLKFSIIQQLGFLPPDLPVDALEISFRETEDHYKAENQYLKNYPFIQNSDAHMLDQIGTTYTCYNLEHRSLDEIRMALKQKEGRFIKNMAYCEK
jgi:3',5'-nucleoside bisphosphate phosphatase